MAAISLGAACGGAKNDEGGSLGAAGTAGTTAAGSGSGTTANPPEHLDTAQLALAVDGLCQSLTTARSGQGVQARNLFYDESHDELHRILGVLRSVDPQAADTYEAVKNNLEVTFGYLFQGRDPVPDLEALIGATSDALVRIGQPPPPPCPS